MKIWLPAVALSVALTVSVAVAPANAIGGAPGAAGHGMGGFHGHGFGFPHRFRPHFFRQLNPFHQRQPNFGAGFVSHQSNIVTGGYGDDDYASGDDSGSYEDDDIDNLHFRVQEPFGPGDIGRPPVRAEEEAPYMSDRTDPWHGYAPDR